MRDKDIQTNQKLRAMLKKRDIELLYQVVEKLVENNHTPIEIPPHFLDERN